MSKNESKDMAHKTVPHSQVPSVPGIRLGVCSENFAHNNLTAIAIDSNSTVSGVFTQNQLPAAPVVICQEHLKKSNNIRGILINAGVANAGTGERGLQDARRLCRQYAEILGCQMSDILPASTGVIGEYLPVERHAKELEACAKNLSEHNWPAAAHAIMTSDTMPKIAYETVTSGNKTHTVVGMAKGIAMVQPNMATMLSVVATDAVIDKQCLMEWQRSITNDTFNAISVDGDTSTNDTFFLIATGKGGVCAAEEKLRQAIFDVCARLSESIVKDGVGASKQLTVVVSGGKSEAVCKRLARTVASSALVKMSISNQEVDAGRILMAIGNGANNEDLTGMIVTMCDFPIIEGNTVVSGHDNISLRQAMSGNEIVLSIKLGDSPFTATFKTCDLTRQYIERFGTSKTEASAPQKLNTHEHRRLIAVIGEAATKEGEVAYQMAQELGTCLVDAGFRVCSGGLGGVMSAAFLGARQSNNYKEGDTIAIIPTLDRSDANPYADIVIPTGLGHLRNGIVAAADAIVVVGGKSGTLSEMAFAWKYNRLIVALSKSGGMAKEYAGKPLDDRPHRHQHPMLMTVANAHTPQEAVNLINEGLSEGFFPANDFSK